MNPVYQCTRCNHLSHRPNCCGSNDTRKITDREIKHENPIYLANEIYRLLLRERVMFDALISIEASENTTKAPITAGNALEKLSEI